MTVTLGSMVSYTHQAAVARKGGLDQSIRGWNLPAKGNGEIPGIVETDDGLFIWPLLGEADRERRVWFVDAEGKDITEQGLRKWNKAVACWYAPGSGVVTGLERKQYGESHGPSGGTNLYGEGDWEPGYFVPFGNVDLYVVRWELRGRKFVYVPTWAVKQ